MRRLDRPARRFAIRTALVLLLLGVVVHAFVVQTVDAELSDQVTARARLLAEEVVAPALAAGSSADEVAAAAVADDPQVLEVVLRDADGLVVGRAGAADTDELRTRVPLDGGLVAVVVQDRDPVAAVATDVTRRIAVVLAAGLLLLWLAIVPLAHRLGRELRGQADELREQAAQLREQGAELERLLEQEQRTVQRLREVDELRDQFLESVSHELRTPLTVVKGALQMLHARGEALPPEMRAELVARAHEKAERLNALVQGLLDLNASADANGRERRWVGVARATTTASRALPPIDVTHDLEVDGIVTDPAQLVRALGALLGNVARHAPGAAVVVRTSAAGDDGVELVVEDDGPGIPPDLREAVFEPFRHGPLRDAHSPGTGIGLSLVAAWATQHDGRAWADERPGGGTRIHVLLPGTRGERPADDEVDDDDLAAGIVVPVVSGETTPRPTPGPPPARLRATDPPQPERDEVAPRTIRVVRRRG